MRFDQFFKQVLWIFSFLFLSLAACAPREETDVSVSTPSSTSEIMPATTTAPSSTEKPVIVAYAKDGGIQLWNSETNQAHTILKVGDVSSVMVSDDGQVIAFTRRALYFQPDLMENNSLWAVDINGENPRELVSNELLRQLLNPSEADSAGFAQISWVPGTHRLVYSGVKFYAPGQGFTNSTDIYIVHADTLSNTVLAPDIMPDVFLNAWRFVLSPDGQQIAILSGTQLSFINLDGSNRRQAVLSYPIPPLQGDGVLLPTGIWTQDSHAFVLTGPMQSEPKAGLSYTIWRVRVDGSSAQSLAALTETHSSSITFSPNGQNMAFLQDINTNWNWVIMPLALEAGPLAIPYSLDIFYANLHWSPGGTAYMIKDQDLLELCPGATQASQVCGDPIHLGNNNVNYIQWVDDHRFLFTGLEPATLSLGNVDGTIKPIATWVDDAVSSGWSFYTLH